MIPETGLSINQPGCIFRVFTVGMHACWQGVGSLLMVMSNGRLFDRYSCSNIYVAYV